jgi:large subunit ribosomal protein L24
MKIKTGDKVIVISGKDKGKTGVVVKAFPKIEKVVIDDVNIARKHRKAQHSGAKGEIVEIPMPIHISNVAFVDPKTKKPTRIRYDMQKNKKVRIAVKSGTVIK